MLYKNTVTGAVIDCTSQISGGNWVVLEDFENSKPEPKKEKEEKVEKVEETESEGYNSITVPEIKNELDALGIEYDKSAQKAELWKLLQDNI